MNSHREAHISLTDGIKTRADKQKTIVKELFRFHATFLRLRQGPVPHTSRKVILRRFVGVTDASPAEHSNQAIHATSTRFWCEDGCDLLHVE